MKEKVKNTCFRSGAGKIGNYTNCCFEWQGRGQFLPMKKSNPSVGKKLQVNKIREVKIEMVVAKKLKGKVIQALRKSHPYEEPAFGFIPIEVE